MVLERRDSKSRFWLWLLDGTNQSPQSTIDTASGLPGLLAKGSKGAMEGHLLHLVLLPFAAAVTLTSKQKDHQPFFSNPEATRRAESLQPPHQNQTPIGQLSTPADF